MSQYGRIIVETDITSVRTANLFAGARYRSRHITLFNADSSPLNCYDDDISNGGEATLRTTEDFDINFARSCHQGTPSVFLTLNQRLSFWSRAPPRNRCLYRLNVGSALNDFNSPSLCLRQRTEFRDNHLVTDVTCVVHIVSTVTNRCFTISYIWVTNSTGHFTMLSCPSY